MKVHLDRLVLVRVLMQLLIYRQVKSITRDRKGDERLWAIERGMQNKDKLNQLLAWEMITKKHH